MIPKNQKPQPSTSKHFDTGSFIGYQYHTSKQEPVMKQVLRYRFVRRVSVPHQQARTYNEATSITNQGQKNKHQQVGTCNEAGTSIQVRS